MARSSRGSFSPLQAQHAGGVITEEDFSNYSALVEKPVCGVYRGDLSPRSQGSLLRRSLLVHGTTFWPRDYFPFHRRETEAMSCLGSQLLKQARASPPSEVVMGSVAPSI